MDILIIVLGAVVGVLVGMTGMGGGALMTPALITLIGVSPTIAVSSDIIYGAITKTFGALQHMRQKTVDGQLVKRLAVGSIPAAILGSLVASQLQKTGLDIDSFIKTALGIVLCLIAFVLFVSAFMDVNGFKQRIHHLIGAEKNARAWLAGVGAFGGFIVGLTSVGSGTVMMAAILIISNTSLKKIVGSDIAHATLLLFTAGITHLFVGHVDWALVGMLLIGSIPGVLIGSKLSTVVPKQLTKILVITLLCFFGVKLLL